MSLACTESGKNQPWKMNDFTYSIGAGVCAKLLGIAALRLAQRVRLIEINKEHMFKELCTVMKKTDYFYFSVCITGPVVEELVLRHLVQKILLPNFFENKISQKKENKEKSLNSRVDKAARIGLATVLFSSVHLLNKGFFSDDYIKMQVLNALTAGMVFGIVRETRLGLLGAVIAHVAHNCIAGVVIANRCSI